MVLFLFSVLTINFKGLSFYKYKVNLGVVWYKTLFFLFFNILFFKLNVLYTNFFLYKVKSLMYYNVYGHLFEKNICTLKGFSLYLFGGCAPQLLLVAFILLIAMVAVISICSEENFFKQQADFKMRKLSSVKLI